MGSYKRTAEHIKNWRRSMERRLKAGPIDKSRCGLPRNSPKDIWKRIEKRGPDECWNWQGTKDPSGYGVFRIQGKYFKAHRVAYCDLHSGIPLRGPDSNYEKGFILHHCDNRLCCNPKHLYVGDIWDNMRDKVNRGRVYRGGPFGGKRA